MDETAYLLASPANRAELMRAIADSRSGPLIEKTMEELLAYERE
jgi:PHD/YefM family antitoxin component YafN of YafNO toxin-antitoxin module